MKSLSRYIIESSSSFVAKIDIIENGKIIDSLNAQPCYSATDYKSLQSLEMQILDNFLYLGKHPHITFKEYIEDKNGKIVHEHKYTPTIRDIKDYSYVAYTYYHVKYTDEDGKLHTYENQNDGHYGEYDELKDAKNVIKSIRWNEDYKDPYIVCSVEAYEITNVEPLSYRISDAIEETSEAPTFAEAFRKLKKQLSPDNIVKYEQCVGIEMR